MSIEVYTVVAMFVIRQEYNIKEITDRKLLHMRGVAKYMSDHAEDYGLEPDKSRKLERICGW